MAMMTTKQAFKHGIQEGNWDVICDVYRTMTGEEPPEPPKPIVVKNEFEDILNSTMEVADIIAQSSIQCEANLYVEDHDDKDDEDIEEPRRQSDEDFTMPSKADGKKTKGRRCKKEPLVLGKQKNKFVDDGTQFEDERVDMNPNKPELGIRKVRPRGERPDDSNTGNKVNVVCSLCGKEESVSPLLSRGYSTNKDDNTYKCNECNSPQGRAKLLRQR